MQINLKINKNRNSDSPLQKNGVPILVHAAAPSFPSNLHGPLLLLVSIPIPPSNTPY